tara:strand:- start:3604 stop:4587 length:984 start_codon:yes stop_codon:yes gene_type:complete
MKNLYLFLLLITISTASAQNLEHKEYYENGNTKVEYSGKKDAPDGIVKMYYETGELQAKLIFKKGTQHGPSTIYYPSGTIQKEMTYKDGSQEDTMKIYYENGNLAEISFIQNNAKNGRIKIYFENGKIQIDGNTKDGNIHGYCTYYNEDGEKVSEGEYKMGQKIGTWKEYNAYGVTMKEYKYSEYQKLKKDNISIEYPSTWTSRDLPDYFILLTEPSNRSSTTFDITIEEGHKKLKSYCKFYENKMSKNDYFKEFKVLAKIDVDFKGYKSIEYLCTSKVMDTYEVFWKSIIFIKDQKLYKLSTTSSIDEFYLKKEITDKIFESFEIN